MTIASHASQRWPIQAIIDRGTRAAAKVATGDVYDDFVNPNVQGNFGGLVADRPAWDGLPASAQITLPANSILVFGRDFGN